jgi:uncharacterized protein YukE
VTGFRADLEGLSQLLDRLHAVDRRAAGIVADLEQDARRLETQWSGLAAERHEAAHRQWAAAHAALQQAAAALAAFARAAHANYSDAAAANVRMWS